MISVTRLDSGYYHIRGVGPCNWSQPPRWPCSEEEISKYAFPEASKEFIKKAAALAELERLTQENQQLRRKLEDEGLGPIL